MTPTTLSREDLIAEFRRYAAQAEQQAKKEVGRYGYGPDAEILRTEQRAFTLAADRLSLLPAETRPTCEWSEDSDGGGNPSEHCQKFCGYCGGTLVEKLVPVDTEESQS